MRSGYAIANPTYGFIERRRRLDSGLHRGRAADSGDSVVSLSGRSAKVTVSGSSLLTMDFSVIPIGANNLWIAAHARAAKLTAVTTNTCTFERVDGLKLENWAP